MDFAFNGQLSRSINDHWAYQVEYTCVRIFTGSSRGRMPLQVVQARVGDYEGQTLSTGHLCAVYESLSNDGDATCLASDAVSRVFRRAPRPEDPQPHCSDPDVTEAKCCLEVEPGTQAGVGGFLRRVLLADGWGAWTLYAALPAVFLIGMAAASAFVVLVVWFLRAWIGGIWRAALIGWRALEAPRLTQWAPRSITSTVAVQLTDLHLVETNEHPYELNCDPGLWEDTLPDGRELIHRSHLALEHAFSLGSSLIVVSGDITDGGLPVQWDVAKALFQPRPPFAQLFAIPGNHDLSLNYLVRGDIFSRFRYSRAKAFTDFATSIGMASVFRSVDDETLTWPRCVVLAGPPPLLVLGINSNTYESHFVLSNAVGKIGATQLNEAEKALAAHTGPVLVLIHHHPGWHALDGRSISGIPTIASDCAPLLDNLAVFQARGTANRVLVAHGHQHKERYGTYVASNREHIPVFGCPSTTLGAHVNETLDRKIYIGVLGFDDAGQWAARVEELAL